MWMLYILLTFYECFMDVTENYTARIGGSDRLMTSGVTRGLKSEFGEHRATQASNSVC